jgi:hypothetical protein
LKEIGISIMRIEKDGKFYRMRRGKLVQIPPEWVGTQKFRRDRWKKDQRAEFERLAHKEDREVKKETLEDVENARVGELEDPPA